MYNIFGIYFVYTAPNNLVRSKHVHYTQTSVTFVQLICSCFSSKMDYKTNIR